MRRGLRAGMLALPLIAAGATCERLPLHSDFRVGMAREEVRQRFGEPLRRSEMRKTGPAVWGPIEDFWSRVPMGARVEVWSYRSRHPLVEGDAPGPGTTELYFVDGAARVTGLGFAPDGVVYEPG
jgi:hypothetical protein